MLKREDLLPAALLIVFPWLVFLIFVLPTFIFSVPSQDSSFWVILLFCGAACSSLWGLGLTIIGADLKFGEYASAILGHFISMAEVNSLIGDLQERRATLIQTVGRRPASIWF